MDAIAMSHASKGLPISVAIPGMSIGEYDYGPTAGKLVLGIADGSLTRYVNAKRNIMYAGDAARGFILCLEKGKPGERYILAGENLTMEALTALIAERAGVKKPAPVPGWLARAFAGLQSARYRLGGPAPSITPAAIKVLAGGNYYDGSKAHRELGFTPETSVSEAIDRTIRWFRETGHLTDIKKGAL
jgi:dihydroflavonol-4-reductase